MAGTADCAKWELPLNLRNWARNRNPGRETGGDQDWVMSQVRDKSAQLGQESEFGSGNGLWPGLGDVRGQGQVCAIGPEIGIRVGKRCGGQDWLMPQVRDKRIFSWQ